MRILLVSNVLTMNALGLCIILFLFSASGLLIRLYKGSNPRVFHWLIALGAGSMLSVSLVHILAETLEQTQFALYAFMAGFLAIYCIEELLTPHRQDKAHDGHTHEDPHEHSDHVALVTFGAIFLHTLFDGFGIRAGFWVSETLGYWVLLGVLIHQVPVSFSLAAILQTSTFRKSVQMKLLLIFAWAAPLGFALSDVFLQTASQNATALASAFAGGSLLYVATADLLPVIHAQERRNYVTALCFVLGAVGMTLLRFFE